MKFRLSLELHVTRHKPNKPEPEADHQPRGDNYAATERAHPEPEGGGEKGVYLCTTN